MSTPLQINTILGENLGNLMAEVGLTQQALANELGVAQSQVSKWVNGRICIPPHILYELARRFEIPMDDLFGKNLNTIPRYARDSAELRRLVGLWRGGDMAGILDMVADRLRGQ